jgi:chromosome segregation ATPase
MKSSFNKLFEDLSLIRPVMIYEAGVAEMRWGNPTDTQQVSRYIENPEWLKQNLKDQMDALDKRIGYYDAQIERLISLKGEIKDQKEKLKKELKDLEDKQ